MSNQNQKQIILTEQEWECVKSALRQSARLAEHVIRDQPNAFRPALEVSKTLTQLQKITGISDI